MSLYEEKCHRPEPNQKPIGADDARKLLKEIPGWNLKGDSIERTFQFHDFRESMDFVNRVAEIANSHFV